MVGFYVYNLQIKIPLPSLLVRTIFLWGNTWACPTNISLGITKAWCSNVNVIFKWFHDLKRVERRMLERESAPASDSCLALFSHSTFLSPIQKYSGRIYYLRYFKL